MRKTAFLILVAGASALCAQQPVKPVVATAPAVPVVAVPAAVPIYAAVHVPSDSADLNELRREQAELKKLVLKLSKQQEELVTELKAMRLQQQPTGAGQPPAAPRAPAEVEKRAAAVVQARCAACHDTKATLAGKGGGLELIRDGVLGTPDKDTLGALREAVEKGTMPPPKNGGQLDSDEKNALLLHYKK